LLGEVDNGNARMQTAALEKLDSGAHVDLVCSDIVLPGAIDGLALAAQLELAFHARTHRFCWRPDTLGNLSLTCALIRLEASQQFADFRFRAGAVDLAFIGT
jgi:CheY-like chemotaxis protein